MGVYTYRITVACIVHSTSKLGGTARPLVLQQRAPIGYLRVLRHLHPTLFRFMRILYRLISSTPSSTKSDKVTPCIPDRIQYNVSVHQCE